MKKSAIGLEQIVLAIIALVTVAGVTIVILKQADKPVEYLLGINISGFDQDIVERYEVTRSLESSTIDSVDALIYAINRLAVVDTYGTITKTPADELIERIRQKEKLGEFDDYEAEFGGTSVRWTILDQRNIKLNPNNEVRDFVRKIIECDAIFQDKLENTKCFGIYPTELTGTITKEKIVEDIEKYYNDPECTEKKNCQDRIEGILGRTPGDVSWYRLDIHLSDAFNLENFEWKLESDTLSKNSKPPLVQICGDTKGINAVMITSDLKDCVPPKTADKAFGFSITNFNLPQQIQKSDNILVYGIEEWLNIYGDPKYLLYYEQFPEGQDAYWQASAYNIGMATILTAEGIFLVFDFIPFGRAAKFIIKKIIPIRFITRLVNGVLKPIASAVTSKIGIKQIYNLAKTTVTKTKDILVDIAGYIKGTNSAQAIGRVAKSAIDYVAATPQRMVTRLLRTQLIGDYVETISKKTVKSRLQKAMGKSFKNLDNEAIGQIEEAYVKAFKNAKEKFGDELVDKYGKMPDDVLKTLDNEFDKIFREVKLGDIPEDQIRSKALFDIFEKRMDPEFISHPIYGKEAVDKLLRDNGIEPGTDAAQRFMQEWDYKHAEELMINEHNEIIKKLKQASGDAYYNRISKELNDGMKKDLRTATFRTIPRGLKHMFNAASAAKKKLKRLASTGVADEEKEEILKEIAANTDFLDQMARNHPADFRKFLMDNKKTVDLLWDAERGMPKWDIDELAPASTKEELTKNLDAFLEKKVDLGIRIASQIEEKTLKGIKKKRHIITAAAVYGAIRLNSIQAKHVSVGTNAIGLRTPFLETVPYKEVDITTIIPGYVPNLKTDSGKKNNLDLLEKNYFPFYTDKEKRKEDLNELYMGLLPEVEKYYLSLTRDKEAFWFDQEPIRFHLVSPCKSDIFMRVSRCDCYGEPRESTIGKSSIPLIGELFEDEGIYITGQEHELDDGRTIDFDFDPDDNDEMLYKLDEEGIPLKYCVPAKWYRYDTLRQPKCMKINPVLADVGEDEYNYCYHGSGGFSDAALDAGLNFALPLGAAAAGLLCGPGAVICVPVFGAVGGAAGGITYSWINTGSQWPNHD